jgi:hypothetical protein
MVGDDHRRQDGNLRPVRAVLGKLACLDLCNIEQRNLVKKDAPIGG